MASASGSPKRADTYRDFRELSLPIVFSFAEVGTVDVMRDGA
jgi:hypothetical protein